MRELQLKPFLLGLLIYSFSSYCIGQTIFDTNTETPVKIGNTASEKDTSDFKSKVNSLHQQNITLLTQYIKAQLKQQSAPLPPAPPSSMTPPKNLNATQPTQNFPSSVSGAAGAAAAAVAAQPTPNNPLINQPAVSQPSIYTGGFNTTPPSQQPTTLAPSPPSSNTPAKRGSFDVRY